MSHLNNIKSKDASVTFRIDPELKTELSRLAVQNHKSLGELLREMAQQRLALERRRTFEDDARRQSLEAAAAAREPASDESTVMRELDADLDEFNDEWK